MAIEVGSVVEGKVSGIMPFGAFITLEDNKVGLVHISEISLNYVKDINDHLKVGDAVKAQVIRVDGNGKISLSIKKAMESKRPPRSKERPPKSSGSVVPADIDWGAKSGGGMSFEDKLSKFKQDSDEKMLALKRNTESKRSGGYKRGGGTF